MISRVRDGITARSRSSQSIRGADSAVNLMRRLSGKRKHNNDPEGSRKASQPRYEISRNSIDSYDESQEHSGSSSEASLAAPNVCSDEPLNGRILSTPHFAHSAVQTGTSLPETKWPLIRTTSPSLEKTPRPSARQLSSNSALAAPEIQIIVPYVDLEVLKDCDFIAADQSGDFVVTIVATVRSRFVSTGEASSTCQHSDAIGESNAAVPTWRCIGSITSLRLCYKPINGCTVSVVDGRKAMKGLQLGQTCSLRLKVRVPQTDRGESEDPANSNLDTLFNELESMVGTLCTDTLLVEVKYRHSLLVNDVVMVRQTCSIRRPDLTCRWSVVQSPPLTSTISAAKLLTIDRAHHELAALRQKRSTTVQPSPPKTTTAVKMTSVSRFEDAVPDAQDSARTLWRHLRRSSQVVDIDAAAFEGDEKVKALKEKALANKRSVGTETLRGWQFDEKVKGETPWL